MSILQEILTGSSARSTRSARSEGGSGGPDGPGGANGAGDSGDVHAEYAEYAEDALRATGGGAVIRSGTSGWARSDEGAGGDGTTVPGEGTAGRRTVARVLRPGRTPAAIVVAAVLALLGWGLTVQAVAVMLRVPLPWRLPPRLLHLTLADPAVPLAAVGMIVCGAGLVALAVVPGRPRLVPLRCEDPLLAMGLTRVGLRRTLISAAREVEDVRRANVHILRGRIEVTVVTGTARTGAVLREVGAAVGDRLAGLGVQARHEVVVRLRGRGN
ncbi:DUF6286 domain-containing protein [Microbispora amethystogenes]|uniref:DUF6286 domain-containing protein n=1 Tax=Microbispora amethystogenes TaxID=1427754 RepID=UPI0033D670A6